MDGIVLYEIKLDRNLYKFDVVCSNEVLYEDGACKLQENFLAPLSKIIFNYL